MRRRLALDEAKWAAMQMPEGRLLDANDGIPSLLDASSAPLRPMYAAHSSRPLSGSTEAHDYLLSVPSAAIEPPLSKPILCVLETLVNYAHNDPSSTRLFSGLAAIDFALAVTGSGTPFRSQMENLKLRRHVYLRMLEWVAHTLGDTPDLALQLPLSVATTKPLKFSHDQQKAL